jgi:hypothetical protein
MTRRLVLTTLVALTVAASGCASRDTPAAQPTPSAPTTANASAVPASSERVPDSADTSQSAAAAGSELVPTGVRIGRHNGFDRVVYDLSGPGAPGWWVGYVARATSDGKGDVVPVDGVSILQVMIRGCTYPEPGQKTVAKGPITEPTAQVITQVWPVSIFEGDHQSFIGARSAKPAFAVSVLKNPTRLVVDIANTAS